MSQGITLYGSEGVERAGYAMNAASEQMSRAAATIEECTRRLEMLFGQGYGSNLDRLIEALENNAPPIEKPTQPNP